MTQIEFLLTRYQPFDWRESHDLDRLRQHAAKAKRSLYQRIPGQPSVVASAVVVNPDMTRILLMHHLIHKFHKQFGGHADGNTDLAAVATDELRQESGICAAPVSRDPFDVIIWRMVSRTKNGIFYPQHDMFDIAFPFIVPDDVKFKPNAREGVDIKWMPLTEYRDMKFDPDNTTLKLNPHEPEYNRRIYKKIMLLKERMGK